MYILCTKDSISNVCNKILKSEISKIHIKQIDNNYMMKIEINSTNDKYDTKILAKLYSEIQRFYTCLVYEKVYYFELNYDLKNKQYNLFDSYEEEVDEDHILNIEKAKEYLRRSLELFEKLGVDKLHLETIYTKEKNRYKNISFIEALTELNKYI